MYLLLQKYKEIMVKKAAKKTPKKVVKKTTPKKKAVKKTPKKVVAKKTPKKATKKAVKVADLPLAAPVRPEADVIWDEIRQLQTNLFGLPNQYVETHTKRVVGIPEKLYLICKVAAVLPALEEVLSTQTQVRVERTPEGDPIRVAYPKYDMEEAVGYVIISRHVPLDEHATMQPKNRHHPAILWHGKTQ